MKCLIRATSAKTIPVCGISQLLLVLGFRLFDSRVDFAFPSQPNFEGRRALPSRNINCIVPRRTQIGTRVRLSGEPLCLARFPLPFSEIKALFLMYVHVFLGNLPIARNVRLLHSVSDDHLGNSSLLLLELMAQEMVA